MPKTWDVIVVGLGAMGSAAVFHLARSGSRVLGIDRFTPPHVHGSSHGQTRIIREAYFEHPTYVPLVQRAYELWEDLERQSHATLFQRTGGLMIGPPDGVVVAGALRSAREHGLAHETLAAEEVRRRFPGLHPASDMAAVLEPRAGILFPEKCVEAHLKGASLGGADLHLNETVQRWKVANGRVEVSTERHRYEAERLLLTAGPWLPDLVPDLNLPLRIERQVQFWFTPVRNAPDFHPDRCPIHLWETSPGRFFYGFPDLGAGVKVARHHEGDSTNPESVEREVRRDDEDAMRAVLSRFIPHANGPLVHSAVCLYTNTPDGHFLVDTHPGHPDVLLASPCSGHGFKFSSAIGEVLAGMLCGKPSRLDLSLFRHRFPK